MQKETRQSTVTGFENGIRKEPTFDEAIADVLGADAAYQWNVQGPLFRHRIEAKDRTDVLRRVFLDSDPRWMSAFIVMLVLAAGLAALGLSQNSAATVIGSMIVAPLGGPIVALGAAIAVVWPREAAKMFGIVVAGAITVVVVSFAIGILLPQSTPTAQILSRTSPDLRDLGVALLAGTAAAYAQTRTSLSSSLIGVAIAVALVPPLATVGLMLEEGRWILASGAFTLFAANLIGIVFAAAVTLLVTRYAPLPKLRSNSVGLFIGLGATILAVVAISIPLAITYRQVAATARTATAVHQQVANTLGSSSSAIINQIDVNGNHVVIDLSGADASLTAEQLAADLRNELGPDVTVELR